MVRTLTDAGRDDWLDIAREARRWGIAGTVVRASDSHGLCYLVRHADGTEAWYDHDEVEALPKGGLMRNRDEHAWFKRFMGMPEGDGVSGGKSGLVALLLFLGAVALMAWLMSGCQAECVRSCNYAMNDCFDNAKGSAERQLCVSSNETCVQACAGTRIRVKAGGASKIGPSFKEEEGFDE